MHYDVWLAPHMPTPEERNTDYFYIPEKYSKDERLNYLDKELYFALVSIEQLSGGTYDVQTLIKELDGVHPDKSDAIFDAYLAKTGKSVDSLTDKEFKSIPTVPLTEADVIESLSKLEQLGYIEKK